jgi:membrane fusion protein
MAWGVVGFAISSLCFLVLAQSSRKETVAGYLAPASGTARVFVPRPGVVRSVHVTEGQVVEAGQPLLTIDTDHIAASGEDLNATMLSTLETQRERLRHQIKAESKRTFSEQRRLETKIQELGTELAHLNGQVALQGERIELSKNLIPSANQLSARGLLSDIEHKRRMESLLEQRQNLMGLEQQIAARRGQLAEAKYGV